MQLANKADKNCNHIKKTLIKDKYHCNRIFLNQCFVHERILNFQNKIWVFNDPDILIKLIREVYNFFINGHLGIHRIIKLLRRNYYWSNMRKKIKQYIRNWYICYRFKTSKNKYNDKLIPAFVFTQRWIDFIMNFITKLFKLKNHNAICTIMNKLIKKRHYEPYIITDEDTSAEATTEILIREIFRYYELPFSVTSN